QDCGQVDNDPDDGDGHGTHVAGTIAAITNNNLMAAGVAGGFASGSVSSWGNGVEVMAMRIGYHAKYQGQITGIVRMDWAAEAMSYVADQIDRHNINVAAINCSWDSSNTGGIDAAVDNLLAHDVMIIHSAGNNNSATADYLGAKAGVMNVAATDVNGAGAGFSNHGAWVDLAGPGVDVLSTYAEPGDPDKDNHYIALLSGTSMAAPHVAGVAALLESFDPNLSGPEKLDIMVNTTTPYNDSRNLGAGIINAYNALQAIGPPESPTNVNAEPHTQCDEVLLSWIASARAAGYRIYYQENTPGPPFDPCQPGNPASGADVGDVTEVIISDLIPQTTYYFAVTAYDALGESDYSNQDSAVCASNCKVIISGYIQTISGFGIEAVKVNANKGGGSALTDPNGYYQLEVPWGWTDGTVTVGRDRWMFDPNHLEYPGMVTENQTAQNYIGRASADFDADGDVDIVDLAFFHRYWLQSDCISKNNCDQTDLDLSNKVDMIDFGLFAEQYLKK
ncbi:MAG: hypothetical protein AMJ79_01265, partial [Phycisphaerae bacterium SM23_30]